MDGFTFKPIEITEDDFTFEPIEITKDDLIDITEEEYREMLKAGDEALDEFLKDLESQSDG